MGFRSVEFVKGVTGTEGLPKELFPTVAFFGRSNVGKSSVLNSLVGQKNMARVSARSGRTTEINYFLIDGAWFLVDLPGYGYAKLPAQLQKKIEKHLSWYASEISVPLRAAVLIVDAEVGVKDSDRGVYTLLREAGREVILVANKSDKGRRNDIVNNIRSIAKEFPESRVIRYSAKTNEGRSELLSLLLEKVSQ